MGVLGLWPLLQPFTVTRQLQGGSSTRVGVDAMVQIHAILMKHAPDVMHFEGPRWAAVDKDLHDFVTLFGHYSPDGVVVVDGRRVVEKEAAMLRMDKRASHAIELETKMAILDDLRRAVAEQDADEAQSLSASAARGALAALTAAQLAQADAFEDDSDEHGAAAADSSSAEPPVGEDGHAGGAGATAGAVDRLLIREQIAKATTDVVTLQRSTVGKYGPEAARRLQVLCRKAELRFEVALGEAEHHLHQLAEDGHIDSVWIVDSDTVILGFQDIIFARNLRSREMHGRVPALNMAQMQSALEAGVDPAAGSRTSSEKLGRAMRTFGVLPTLRILGYTLKNDYAHVSSVGLQWVIGILTDMLDAGATSGDLSVDSFAAQAQKTQAQKAQAQKKDLLESMKFSAWQFHCQPVARRYEKGFDLHKPGAPRFVGNLATADKGKQSLLAFFDNKSYKTITAWVGGAYNVATAPGRKWEKSPPVDMNVPVSSSFGLLSHDGLKAVAKGMGISTGGTRDVLLKRVTDRHKAVRNGSFTPAKEKELLDRPSPAAVNLEHARTSRAWREALAECPMTPASRENLWHTPPEHVSTYFQSEPSVRRERESQLRVVTDLKHGVSSAEDADGFRIAYVTGRVQLSLPPDKYHEVAVQFRLESDDSGKLVCKGILSAICLLDKEIVDEDTGMPCTGQRGGKIKYKACRAGGRYCVHIHSLLAHMVVLTSDSTTDRKSYWMSDLNRKIFEGKDASAVPFVELVGAEALPRLNYKVFNDHHLRLIAKGLIGAEADPAYRAMALVLRDVIEKEIPLVKERGARIDALLGTGPIHFDTEGARPDRAWWGKAHIFALLDKVFAPDGACAASATDEACEAASSSQPVDGVQDMGLSADAAEEAAEHEEEAVNQKGTSSAEAAQGAGGKRSRRRREQRPTRANAVQRHRRNSRSCACPKGIHCTGKGKHGTVFRTKTQEEKGKWLTTVNPELSPEERKTKLEAEYVNVFSGHFNVMSIRAPSADGQRWRRFCGPEYREAMPHTEQQLQRSEDFWAPRDTQCICSTQGCDEVMTPSNSVVILGDKDEAIIRRLYQGSDAAQWIPYIVAAATKERKLRASQAHFSDQAFDGRGLRHDGNNLPRTTPASAKRTVRERCNPEDRPYRAIARQAAQKGRVGEEQAAKLAKAAVQAAAQALASEPATPSLDGASTTPSTPGSASSMESDGSSKTRTAVAKLIEGMKLSPDVCRSSTGMHSFPVLQSTYNYLNANGALDSMNWWHGPRETKTERGKGGRPRSVTTFEAYVLFMYFFRNGMQGIHTYVHWLGMSEDVIRRIYITMLHAVTTIMGCHQVYPTYEAMRQAVPPKTKVDIGLDADAKAVVLAGDATERRVCRPTCPCGAVYFSDYKQFTSLKTNAVCTCNTYVCEVSEASAACASDNTMHVKQGMAERLAAGLPDGYAMVYLYDKGLTAIDYFAQHGILLMTPWMKRQHEVSVAEPEAKASRGVASSRIIIEQLFGEMRTFKVIGEASRLARGHEMDLEMELARCLINWRPPTNDWLTREE